MANKTINELEKETLEKWRSEKIFHKTLEKSSPKGDFVFYDGPPFATGTPHYGHIVASLIKDIVPRYKTMQGFHVERKWGWDCHGLPIENIVEKELNLGSKKDIEDLGVCDFNQNCHSKVLMYADEWKKVVERFGRWVDMDDAYKTMDLNFMESVWWVFKQLWDKGLIYEGYKAMHICPHCETTLSQSEVSQEYKDVKDLSLTAKFELEDEPGTFVLAWTTTPWTLPGNVALAVGENLDYIKISSQGEKYIVLKNRVEEVFKDKEYEILGDIAIKDLIGKKYRPLFDYYLQDENLSNRENLYTIQGADFVTTEDGTGVVHIAPAFGEDDMRLGQEKKLPFIQHVGMDGRFKSEVKDFAGLEVKPIDDPGRTDIEIMKFLAAKNLVFSKEKFEHSYPHCWRCDSPLLNYATSAYFVDVTKLKPQILKNAENINWMPSYLKDGRFGNWLAGARDWSISRQRFWGSVMPIWVCSKCGQKKVMGSVADLETANGKKVDDLHKHIVDEVTFDCECGGQMHRVPDVLDCWFESGSMPYAQMHYPFENQARFEANFPAEFIAEGVDQTRCWFYYLLVLSTALFDQAPFKNAIANGIVLAEDGRKMSKKLQNYPDPMDLFDQYGVDAVRFYLATSTVVKAEDLCFSAKGVDEVVKKVLLILGNVMSFYQMYATESVVEMKSENLLDLWILARLKKLTKEITEGYEKYDLNQGARPLTEFVDELSTWYLRRSRERFKGEDQADKAQALATLKFVLLSLSKLVAPVMPFVAERLYAVSGGAKESAHLEDWPLVEDLSEQDLKIMADMITARSLVELGHNLRVEKTLPVRQALGGLSYQAQWQLNERQTAWEEILKSELNVLQAQNNLIETENWVVKKNDNLALSLDTMMTPELKNLGYQRELVRHINDLRKQSGLSLGDRIKVYYQAGEAEVGTLIKNILPEVLALEVTNGRMEDLASKEINLDEQKVWLGIEVLK